MVKSRKGGDPSVKRSGKSSYPWVWKCFWGWKGFVQFTMTLLIPLCVWMLKLKLFDWNCEAKVCELEQEKIKEEMEKKKTKAPFWLNLLRRGIETDQKSLCVCARAWACTASSAQSDVRLNLLLYFRDMRLFADECAVWECAHTW